jgi:hypothetical protein
VGVFRPPQEKMDGQECPSYYKRINGSRYRENETVRGLLFVLSPTSIFTGPLAGTVQPSREVQPTS